MRKMFGPYYEDSVPEASFWQECFFTFDANVLLNLYQLRPPARKAFLQIIEEVPSRLWLTHQAAAEYHRGRTLRINEQIRIYRRQDLRADLALKRKELAGIEHHPFCDFQEIARFIDDWMPKVNDFYQQAERQRENYIAETSILAETIAAIFENRVGEPFSSTDLKEALATASLRYQVGMPPGFNDRDKESNSAGDALIWFQLLNEMPSKTNSLLLVTDDSKSDWWRERKSAFPHPELVMEMRNKGVVFHMMNTASFLKHVPEKLGIEVDHHEIEQAAQELNIIAEEVAREVDRQNKSLVTQVLKELGPGKNLAWDSDSLSPDQCLGIKDAFFIRLSDVTLSRGKEVSTPVAMLHGLESIGLLPLPAREIVVNALAKLEAGIAGVHPSKYDSEIHGADKLLSAMVAPFSEMPEEL
jgi:hypothetical protein